MSGTLGNGQRALFANAPVLPAPQTIPTVPAGSNLAAAMMQNHPMSLQSPTLNIPLASMMQLSKAINPSNPTPGNNQTGLVRDANGDWVAGPSMGGAAQPTQMPPQSPMQGLAPGMPGGGQPGMPSMGAPGTPSGAAPGMPSPGSVGMPGAGQPGPVGQTLSWLQNYGGGGSG